MSMSINQADLKRQIKGIAARQTKFETDVEYRTLNAVSKKAKTMTARSTAKASGLKVGQVNRRIKVSNANKRILEVNWNISGRRLVPPGLREIKRKGRSAGISFFGKGKVRKTFISPVEAGGSVPFIITGRNSGKKVAVFVKAGAPPSYKIKGTNRWGGRPVTTFAGHSLPFYMQSDWKDKVRDHVRQIFPEERRKMIKRMQYINANR